MNFCLALELLSNFWPAYSRFLLWKTLRESGLPALPQHPVSSAYLVAAWALASPAKCFIKLRGIYAAFINPLRDCVFVSGMLFRNPGLSVLPSACFAKVRCLYTASEKTLFGILDVPDVVVTAYTPTWPPE